MERSGNFYKAIRLGYILISILIGCMAAKDIGEYNTCPHLCEYCYANSSKKSAIMNWEMHRQNPMAETITGK